MHNIIKNWIEKKKQIPVEIPHGSPYLSGYNEALSDLLTDLPPLLSRIEQELGEFVDRTQEKYYGKDKRTGEETFSGGGQCRNCGKRKDSLEVEDVRTLLHTYCNKE